MNVNPSLADAVVESVKMAEAWHAYLAQSRANLVVTSAELRIAQARHDQALATLAQASHGAHDAQSRVDQIHQLLGLAPMVAKDLAQSMPSAPIALVPDGPSKARSTTRTTTRTRTRKSA